MFAQVDVSILVSRWFHFAAFIVAIGGTVFIRLVLHPAFQRGASEEAARSLREGVFRRWGRVLHTCIAVLLLTGLFNTLVQFPRHPAIPGQMPLYHVVFGLKMVLVLALFFVAIAITGRSRTFESMRRRSPLWLAVSIALAAAIVLLSNVLKTLPATG